MDEYLASLESSPVRSLKKLIEWNKAHAEQALPEIYPQQDKSEKAQDFHMTPEDYKRSLAYVQRMWGRKALTKLWPNITSMSSSLPVTAFYALWLLQRGSTVSFLRDQPTNIYLAGYPVATVPLGQLDFNGRPFSLSAATTAHNEGKLLHFMSAWEAIFPKRAVPNLSRL